ncbi:MAG: hypothetical protein KF800_06670 [Lysobacter sp.]|nr:hypothetical protein [Lysobacter sp.]
MMCRIACSVLVAVSGCLVPLAGAVAQEESFDLRIPAAPMVRDMDDGQELTYELHLSNFARRDLQPRRVDVLDAADGRVLASYEGQALEQRLDRSGLQWRADAHPAIASGRRGVVFIELALSGAPPQALRHRIGYSDTTTGADMRYVEGGHAPVVAGRTPTLAPPLRGGPWVAIHDPRWERGHRRVGYAVDGALRTPGRYAVDWVKLDASARKAPRGSDVAARAYSHGEDVLAVADGVVHSVEDHWPERKRLSDSLTRPEGNRVVLALDNGYFAHYGHLRPSAARQRQGLGGRAGEGRRQDRGGRLQRQRLRSATALRIDRWACRTGQRRDRLHFRPLPPARPVQRHLADRREHLDTCPGQDVTERHACAPQRAAVDRLSPAADQASAGMSLFHKPATCAGATVTPAELRDANPRRQPKR